MNKTIIITGGNTGLGFETAKNIASTWPNSTVVLACRRSEKTKQAVISLKKLTGNNKIEHLELELDSLDSVRSFADKFIHASLPPLYGIVCNAGLQIVSETKRTVDGFEKTFGVNHLGHFLLVNLLKSQLVADGRIVFVSSDTHDPTQKTGMPAPKFEKAEWLAFPEKSPYKLKGTERYTTSKLCNVYCVYELADQFQKDKKEITVNAFNPGMMPGTGLARDRKRIERFLWSTVLRILPLFSSKIRTPKESGEALASLITNPNLSHVTHGYFDGKNKISSSELSYNLSNQKDLWETSLILTK